MSDDASKIKCPDCTGFLEESDVHRNFLNQPDYECSSCLSGFNYQYVQGLVAGREERKERYVLFADMSNQEKINLHRSVKAKQKREGRELLNGIVCIR